jgi:hypothetical protein
MGIVNCKIRAAREVASDKSMVADGSAFPVAATPASGTVQLNANGTVGLGNTGPTKEGEERVGSTNAKAATIVLPGVCF